MINFHIPSSVKKIGSYCFFRSSIKNIKFEENSQLETIGFGAFQECQDLTTIIIPSSVKNIERFCFYGSLIKNIEFEIRLKLEIIGGF